MGKSQETFNKKEKEKKKIKKRKEKEEKKEERKANSSKGQSLEDMLMYIDEDGNFSSTPPDPKKKRINKVGDIEIGVPKASNEPVDLTRTGIVTFFNESKGYGFIKDLESQQSVFVHAKGLMEPIKEDNKVTFETEMTQKGANAINVKLVKN